VMFVVNDSITILILSSAVHLLLLLLPCIYKTSSITIVWSKKVSIAGCSQFRGVQDSGQKNNGMCATSSNLEEVRLQTVMDNLLASR